MKYAGIFFLVICDIAITSFSFNNVAFEKEFGRLRDICISPAGDVYISTSNRDWNPAPGFPTSSDDRIIKLTLSKVTSRNKTSESKPEKIKLPSATLYMNYCGSCHKENGQGVKNIFPSLTNSKVVSGRKNNLLRKVIHGAQVEGQSTEKFDTRMSPFGFLSNEELAAILTYIRKEFGNGAGAV